MPYLPLFFLLSHSRSITNTEHDLDALFGNKVLVLGGDLQQLLPVVQGGDEAQVVAESILSWPLLHSKLKILSLTQNVRASTAAPWFLRMLSDIGKGRPIDDQHIRDNLPPNSVLLPDDMCRVTANFPISPSEIELLQNWVFPCMRQASLPPDNSQAARDAEREFSTSSILTCRNEDTLYLNRMILNNFLAKTNAPTDVKEYLSEDSLMLEQPLNPSADGAGRALAAMMRDTVQPEFLHSQTPSGMPPHVLKLAKGVPIVLLRNICTAEGLCNGTRMVVKKVLQHSVLAEITGGRFNGKQAFIHRLTFTGNQTNELSMVRKQLPVRLGYAITINKAQGQTLSRAAVYLPDPVFAHGQLYVALSRTPNEDATKLLIRQNREQGVASIPDRQDGTSVDDVIFTRNVVYNSVVRNLRY